MHVSWALPPWGWPILVAIAVVAMIWIRRQYILSQPSVFPPVRHWLLILRGGVLLLLLLAMAQPSLYRVHRQTLPAEVVIVVEDSASMALAGGIAGRMRWQRALGLARDVDSLLARRSEPVSITVLRGNGLEPARVFDLAARPVEPPTAVGSDLRALIGEVSGRWAERPLRATVLLADGNDTVTQHGTSPPLITGPGLVLALGVGAPAGPADRLIQDLRYPDVAFQDDEVVVEVSVTSRFSTETTDEGVTVRLRAGEQVVAEAHAPAAGGDGITRLELVVRPPAPGLHVYDLEVAPLANERFLSNNRASVAVTVRKERARLLLLGGRPNWDTHFWARAASQEERLQLEVVYQSPDGLVLADSGRIWTPPADVDAWGRWDGVVLNGWEDLRTQVNWSALAAAVARGLGLLILPDDAWSGGSSRTRRAFRRPPEELGAVLPVRLDAARWERGDWFPYVDAAVGRHPVLAGVSHQVSPGAGLAAGKLPPLTEVVTAIPRGEGMRLLTVRRQNQEGQHQDLSLLILGHEGRGRIAWFGGRRLWELAFWEAPVPNVGGASEQPARRLLRNLLVWTVAGEEEAGLTLVGHRTVYQEGERIRLEAQWRDMRGAPVTDRPMALRVEPLDSGMETAVQVFSLALVPGLPGHAAVLLPPLPAGRYQVRPEGTQGAPSVGREAALVVTPHSLEATQVRQDRRRLRQLTRELGGDYLAGEKEQVTDRLAQVLADLDLAGEQRIIHHRWDIWAGWPLLLLVVVLLGGEWALRRQQGML